MRKESAKAPATLEKSSLKRRYYENIILPSIRYLIRLAKTKMKYAATQ